MSSIKGYEGLYTVTRDGNVYSEEKYRSSGKYKGIHKKRKLKQMVSKSGKGYFVVNLYKDGKMKQKLVHRLIAEAFIPNPNGKIQINHKDGNTKNNSLDNLEWVTPKENSQHACDTGLSTAWHKGNTGKDTPTARPVLQISPGGEVTRWDCASDAVREFDFDSGGITRACKGEYKTHKGFRWEYET